MKAVRLLDIRYRVRVWQSTNDPVEASALIIRDLRDVVDEVVRLQADEDIRLATIAQQAMALREVRAVLHEIDGEGSVEGARARVAGALKFLESVYPAPA